MLRKQLFLLAIIFAALQQEHLVVGGGYHYDHPITTITGPGVVHGGHHFISPLSTIVPLPPVPALPALPTPRPSQGHGKPNSPPAPSKLIASAYLPSQHAVVPSKIYPSFISTIASSPQINQQYQPPPPPSASGSLYLPPTSPSSPDDVFYQSKGRPLKQYAVVEIIDNDIEQGTEPFLPTGYFDGARAQISASGTGASASEVSKLRIGALQPQQQQFLQQQQQAQQGFPTAEAVSLGSGGLGYIRLPNGNVYLGSGSLGYISSQQHQQLLRDVRTRSEAALPDPLHFGHGPLGGDSNGFRFK